MRSGCCVLLVNLEGRVPDDVRKRTTRRTERLEKALDLLIHCDPEVMAGTAVFRATRIPVHLIADMLEQGASVDEILEGYPSLTREMVESARIYATSHSRCEQPSCRSWSGAKPINCIKIRLRQVRDARLGG